jgi:hypothetical protein
VASAVEAPVPPSRLQSIYSRILKGSGIYTIATLVHRMSSVVMLPVFTHFLTADQYDGPSPRCAAAYPRAGFDLLR